MSVPALMIRQILLGMIEEALRVVKSCQQVKSQTCASLSFFASITSLPRLHAIMAFASLALLVPMSLTVLLHLLEAEVGSFRTLSALLCRPDLLVASSYMVYRRLTGSVVRNQAVPTHRTRKTERHTKGQRVSVRSGLYAMVSASSSTTNGI